MAAGIFAVLIPHTLTRDRQAVFTGINSGVTRRNLLRAARTPRRGGQGMLATQEAAGSKIPVLGYAVRTHGMFDQRVGGRSSVNMIPILPT